LVRALAFLIPLVAGYFAGAYAAGRLAQPRTVSGVVFWWIFVISVASVAANLVDRYTRRLIPLSGLLKMTMAFPDKAPSRFRVAQRASNITTLRRRITEAGVEGHHHEASAAELVLSLASALSNHDRKTRGHSERTRAYTDLLSEELKLPETDRDKLRWAALLHDVGKLDVPSEILNKDGALDDKEWAIVRNHPLAGMRLVAPIADWLGPWAKTIEHHHERWDGSGYPHGLAGEQIALGARIVAVADAYDVMTSGRSYQPSRAHSEARKEVARVSGSQFDPKVARALMNIALGKLRWSTGPLAAIADFPFLRPLEALGRDVVTMVTAGALTASAAMGGVLAGPDLSIVDANRAAAAVAATLGLDPVTSVPTTAEPGEPTTTTIPGQSSTTEQPPATSNSTTTTAGTTTSQPPATTIPPTTTTTAPPTTTTTAPPTTTTVALGPRAQDDTAAADGPKVDIPVLSNDTYSANPEVTIVDPGPDQGKAEMVGNMVRYQRLGFRGIVTFSYQLCDSTGLCDTATVTVDTR
jgi:hypothetical protein